MSDIRVTPKTRKLLSALLLKSIDCATNAHRSYAPYRPSNDHEGAYNEITKAIDYLQQAKKEIVENAQ